MRAQSTFQKQTDFALADPENLIRVENHADGVVIRAAHDNFSERRKRSFIRYLAAEGHIPDCYQSEEYGGGALTWVVDSFWLAQSPALKRQTGQLMQRVLLLTGFLWLVEMLVVFATSH